MSCFVKICGVRTVESARAAAAAGAAAIGFNFWPQSKRHVTIDQAARIAQTLPAHVRRFGVFVNPTSDEVATVLAAGVIDTLQLHGDETPERCAGFGAPWLKALRLDESVLASLDQWSCELLLLDANQPGYGGSGHTADWGLAARAAARRKIVLAGGLTPDNVGAAIVAVHPFGVDVASGVEVAPGVQDPDLVTAFVRAAHRSSP